MGDDCDRCNLDVTLNTPTVLDKMTSFFHNSVKSHHYCKLYLVLFWFERRELQMESFFFFQFGLLQLKIILYIVMYTVQNIYLIAHHWVFLSPNLLYICSF